jgi:hypothetical protein
MLEFNVLCYVTTGNADLVTRILKDHDQNTGCHCNLVPHAAMGCVCAGLSKIDKTTEGFSVMLCTFQSNSRPMKQKVMFFCSCRR